MADDDLNPPDGATKPGDDPHIEDQNPADGGGDADGDPPADPTPTVEDVAKSIGWVPRDQYRGDPEKWRPADQYIIHGRDIQQRVSSELREVKQTLDTVARTSAQITADRLEEQRRVLTARFQAAVDEGDPKAAYEASQRLGQIDQQAREVAAPAPPQDVQAFASKNATWFNVDPAATALAIGMSNKLSHLPVPEQLAQAEAEVRRVYPHLFADSAAPTPQPAKPQAQTRQPTTRTAAPPPRAKGFADMPRDAQKIARDMVDRGVLPSVDAYASNYWNMQQERSNG